MREREKRVDAKRKRRLGRLGSPLWKNSDRGEIVLRPQEIPTTMGIDIFLICPYVWFLSRTYSMETVDNVTFYCTKRLDLI